MFETLASWIQQSGDLVYLLAPLFTITVAILPIPAEIPAAINGIAFGPVWGSLVTWSSGLIGAQISFELGRRCGRPLGEKLLPGRWLQHADAAVRRVSWPGLLMLRLVPTVAFTAVNWAAGLTKVPRARFFWTTAIGIFPGAVAFTTTGYGLAWLATRQYGGVLWALLALLLLVALGYVWRRYAARVG